MGLCDGKFTLTDVFVVDVIRRGELVLVVAMSTRYALPDLSIFRILEQDGGSTGSLLTNRNDLLRAWVS